MKKSYSQLILILMITGIAISTSARVSLPAIFGDHMVLQQNSNASFWGWAKPMEEIKITPSWSGQSFKIKADNYSNWKLNIPTPGAGGPYTITIVGHNTIVLRDVLIGEIWLCSGQSNMEWSAKNGFNNAEAEVNQAIYPSIRFFQVHHRTSDAPQIDLEGEWVKCTPETMSEFSAVAYFFGRKLQNELDVPIGLINSSWGGTPAETWMNPDVIFDDPDLTEAAAKIPEMPWCPEKPGATYHSMIAPLTSFAIAGTIWYQGETNTANHETYEKTFSTLIQSWRNEWGSNFPFYYVQIAPYNYGAPEIGARVREAQLKVLKLPNTGMVVTSDIGDIQDIHPGNKQDVGLRLAYWALANTYGKEELPYSGPLYDFMKAEENGIRISFQYAENGLVAKNGPLREFEICGPDRVFIPAKATIEGNTLFVQSPDISDPKAVRYGWSNTSDPNLFNAEGLPASCFRTDDWELKK